MTMLTDVDMGSGSVRLAKDYVGIDYHNDGQSHIDAFSWEFPLVAAPLRIGRGTGSPLNPIAIF
jgi:hypothetical protein